MIIVSPENAIAYCLKEAGISAEQLDAVAFYDKPWIKFERLLETYLSFAPAGLRSFWKAMPLWLKEKLWMGDKIKKELPDYPGGNTLSRTSSIACSFGLFPLALRVCRGNYHGWRRRMGHCLLGGIGQGNKIELKKEMLFPHSIGLLYTAFTYYTGFRVNSGEYKVMGLAPYGEPKYVQTILDNLMDLREDGSFRLNMKYFNYCQGLTMTSNKFHDLFGGPPRQPESELTQREMDLARSVQEVTEEVMLRMARHVRRESGEKNLCLAGGVTLNCVGNGKILRSNIFDNIWIQPAAGDAGGCAGFGPVYLASADE